MTDTSKIREHMEVVGADGVHVGTVDKVDGKRIKLTKVDSGEGAKDISSVLFFFDGLAACVNSSLCDNNAAVTLFNLSAREFASAYGPYILYIRDKYKNEKYGTGVFQTRALKTRCSIF